jgi:hypothetical protein
MISPWLIEPRAQIVAQLASLGPPDRGVLHSFTGDWDGARALLDLGLHRGGPGSIRAGNGRIRQGNRFTTHHWSGIMDLQYSPEARQSPEGLALLEQASALLADILGPQSSQLEKADWQRWQDQKGRTVYRLTVRDDTGQVSTDFTLDELQNPLHMRFRMYRLWGDLLQVRNEQQHEQVQRIVGQLTSVPEGS